MSGNLSGTGGRQNRRSFLKTGLTATAATVGTGLLMNGTKALAQSSSSLTAGDAAILRFLAAGEALEADFYTNITNWAESGTARFREVATIESTAKN